MSVVRSRVPSAPEPSEPSGPSGPGWISGAPIQSAKADVRAPRALSDVVTGWRESLAATWGRVILFAGIWSLLEIVLRPVRWIRHVGNALTYLNLPVAPSLFSVVLLMIIGGATRRRLRMAWWVLFLFQVIAALQVAIVCIGALVSHDVREDIGGMGGWVLLALQVILTAVLLGTLWPCRPAFASRLEAGSRRRALLVLISGLSSSIGTGVGLTLLFPHTLRTFARRVAWGARVALGVEPDPSDPGWFGERGHHWIAALTGLMSALALIAAALVFLRSARAKAYLSAQDELDIRRLLLEHGERDSLGYFATRHDKSVVFAPNRSSALTYKVLADVSLASADPIGPPSAWPAAINAWLVEARTYGWFPAVLSASEQGAQAYVDAGLKAIPLGDEAIIDVDEFTLEGASMQPVRRAARRVHRAGYTITTSRHEDLSAEQLLQIVRRAEDWRGEDTERGFSMALGRLNAPVDDDCVAVLAFDAQGTLRGMLSFVPWGVRGLSLDLMRRDPDSENGLVEAMVAAVVEAGRDELGVRRISLNFAMFRGIFSAADRVGARPMVRLASHGLTFASRFWQIESLYRSNAKYLPQWTPRFLCYDSSLTLTRVALAAGMAEGFLPLIGTNRERETDGTVMLNGQTVPFTEAVAAQKSIHRRRLPAGARLTQQEQARRGKIARLDAAGMPSYPVQVPRTCDVGQIRADFPALAPDVRTGTVVSVVGRVRALRDLGGLVFAVLSEGHARIQIMADPAVLGDAAHRLLRATLDLGDLISVTGEVITTRRGELSVLADSWTMAAKCLRPLPDEHAGFADPDSRLRQRHLDLIVNPDSMDMLMKRSAAVRAIRDSFTRRGFTEVETPMLQSVHGGANARPFQTHINAYDMNLYLRIAPELYLKRLCVGGMERVFELNRNFRNEGADATHNPEFTSVEAYQAFADYNTMRVLTRELILEAATAVYGRPIARRPDPDGCMVDVSLAGEWPVVTVHDAVSAACGVHVSPDTPMATWAAICREHAVRLPGECTPGHAVAELYDALVEKQTLQPTFYTDFPVETSPLARQHRIDPRLAERWDLVAFGSEIGTAYSELTDPIDQRRRLTAQSLQAAAGDPEAMQIDESFLNALEYAMPPTGGLGLGVDRLVMMLTGATIRQTLAFAFIRPGSGH